MRNRSLLLTVILLAILLLAACTQALVPAPPQSGAEPAVPPVETTTTTLPTAMPAAMPATMEGMDHAAMMDPNQAFDAQFIDSMIEHHQGAIDMATMALEQAEHEELRTMADEIIAAQQAEIAQMEEWRAAWYPDLPPTQGMGMAMGDMMLSEDANIAFDQRFLEAMIAHHRGAVVMAEAAQSMGEHEEIRGLADAVIAAQEGEIAQMQKWLQDWYNAQGQEAQAIASIQGTIWVANEEGNSLTVVDAATHDVVATLTGIPGPHNVQVSPDGRTVWVVSGHDGLVAAIDSQTYKLQGTAPVGSAPAHVIVTPDGATSYVSSSGDNTVTIIDTATLNLVATLPVGQYPHGLRSSPDGKLVAVANLRDNTVTLINTATQQVDSTIATGLGPVQVAFAPDGATLYVSLNGEDAVAKIDLATRSVVGTAAVGDGPVQLYVSPDGTLLLVANQGTEESPATTLSFVDTATMAELDKVGTGKGAHGVVIEPGGRYAWVTNLYDNTLAVVDIAARAVVATVPSGASPNGVSFSPLVSPAAVAEVVIPIAEQPHNEPGSESDPSAPDAHH